MAIRGLPLNTLPRLLLPARVADESVQHIFLCIADHWEPKWARPSREVERGRVKRWVEDYPRMAERFADCRGRPPQHAFFYPAEEYEPEHLDAVAEICRKGFGDVEVHLHHDNDTSEGTREKLVRFTETLRHRHGLLRRDATGRIIYAFIHGNWALDNSRCDGRWCGVNDELTILMETGCYVDMTMPSAPADCQTQTINSIYYATDDPLTAKSHDIGVPVRVGGQRPEQSLLLIQGPLALDWRRRKWGILPRIENGDLTGRRPPTMRRLDLWLNAGVAVLGRPNWRFIKLHTHGAQEANAAMLLGDPMRRFHTALAEYARPRGDFRYYYVTPWEMTQLAIAAQAGQTDPNAVLDAADSSQATPAYAL